MSEMQSLLTDTVTRLFTDRVTKDLIEAAEQRVWPERLWQALEEAGLTLPLVPEPSGGAGLTWEDAHVIVRIAGSHTAPVPLAETIVAGWLLARAGIEVPLGPLTLAPVHPGERLELTRDGNTWRLSGRVTRVPWGAVASHVVAVTDVGGRSANGEGRSMVALVTAGGAQVTPDRNLALEPRDTLVFDAAPAVAATASGVSTDALQIYGALVRSAQMAGALDRILQESVRYVGERRQFGRAIGSFQAIQHSLAVLAGHVAAGGIAAEHAFRAADRGHPAFEVAAAKIRTGEAAGIGAGIAHQVHGAIGFTYEHSLHFATRRLWSWRAEFGSESRWAAELGRSVTARGADALWPDLTAR
ncbi:MAG: acyl-CoA dehydrogenase family protein [Candidatus Rokuibacteriota bacterium]